MNDFCPVLLGLSDPFKGHGMVLSYVAAFHQNGSAMLQVNPVVGHCSSTERCPQTGDRGAVSKPGLVLNVDCAEQAHRFLEEIALLVGVLCASHEGDCVCAIDWDIRVLKFLGGNP